MDIAELSTRPMQESKKNKWPNRHKIHIETQRTNQTNENTLTSINYYRFATPSIVASGRFQRVRPEPLSTLLAGAECVSDSVPVKSSDGGLQDLDLDLEDRPEEWPLEQWWRYDSSGPGSPDPHEETRPPDSFLSEARVDAKRDFSRILGPFQ